MTLIITVSCDNKSYAPSPIVFALRKALASIYLSPQISYYVSCSSIHKVLHQLTMFLTCSIYYTEKSYKKKNAKTQFLAKFTALR